jgi:hypothetical protein
LGIIRNKKNVVTWWEGIREAKAMRRDDMEGGESESIG